MLTYGNESFKLCFSKINLATGLEIKVEKNLFVLVLKRAMKF